MRFKKPPGMSPVSVLLAVFVGIAASFGVLLIGMYAWQESSPKVFAVGALVALAATAAGSLGGFLFGLPRFSQVLTVPVPGSPSPAASKLAETAQTRAAAGIYAPSNNLEQISDWLTKLLLGAGLVQLGPLGRWLGGFIDGLARAMVGGDAESAPPMATVVAGSLVVFYTAFGFLSGYITTTLWYRRRLESMLNPPAAEE